MLRQGAQTHDTLKAAFCAHMVLHLMEACAPASPAAALRNAIGSVGSSSSGSSKDKAAADATATAKKGKGGEGPAVLDKWRKLVANGKQGAGEGRQEHAQRLMAASKPVLDGLYNEFSRQAERQGWKLDNTMLNPGETRLLKLQPLAV
jgi:hypothetical protein